jgi:hypothetical protein
MKLFAISAVLVILSTVTNARFFQEEKSPFIKKLEFFEREGTIAAFLADTSGTCIDSLVAAAPPCSMQDQCDSIIDVAKFMGGKKGQALIKIAQGLAQAEKNTPENGLRSTDCNRLPRHPELNGLFATQDPTNGPGKNKPPFVPKKFTTIRKFTLKINGKQIAPGGRFQKPGTHKRGVTPRFNGKVDVETPKSSPNEKVLRLAKNINRSKLNDSQKKQLTGCTKTLKSNKGSTKVKTACANLIKGFAKKFPKRK